jgi:DNA-directed RNA polymerase subunit beta
MKDTINYINSLPDFLEMQRISFCWFITQGLNQEFALFSRISDFNETIEYIMFGEEYSLIKPAYSLVVARKYNRNYKTQLVIPIEIRNKILNMIKHKEFPIITLPLMTVDATFVINGCERVIVSQIIRSPGIFFEKNTPQKRKTNFQRKLSAEIEKLRNFIPSGESFISEFDLFFSTLLIMPSSTGPSTSIFSEWQIYKMYSYSMTFFKTIKNHSSFSFFQCFKLYQIILKQDPKKSKIRFIQLFFQWLKLKKNSIEVQKNLKLPKVLSLLNSFNILLKLLIKFENSFRFFNYFQSEESKTFLNYEKLIFRFQNLIQIQINYAFSFIFYNSISRLIGTTDFVFFQKQLKFTVQKLKLLEQILQTKTLKPTIYISRTFKDQCRYTFLNSSLPDNPERHKYLKTRAKILFYKEDHSIKTKYNYKYDTKENYKATLIPDYGSWIRFAFQKNTKLIPYKYPLKNQEDDCMIQLDKMDQKPILLLLKEMGLTDLEIFQNLEYSDFFYFTKPLLINSKNFNHPLERFFQTDESFKNFSKFSKIFDPTYYRIGRVGRLRINQRLNLRIHERVQSITYDDIFATIDKLISLTVSKTVPDDIDHLKNRRVRSVGELLQNLFRIGFQRLVRIFKNQTKNQSNKIEYFLSFNVLNSTIREFFGSSQLSQYLDQTNPLSSLTHRRRISGLGPGGFDRDRISFAVRAIHPSHYGRICPIETPEGQNVGLISSLTSCARVNKLGFLETPFWRVMNGKVIKTGNPIYLTADIEDLYKIAPADISMNQKNYLIQNLIPVRYKQDFLNVTPNEVDFISISTIQVVSIAASLIPFFEHDDANRALMGSNMQRQSVPLSLPQKPIVGTGLENQIAIDSGMALVAKSKGIVEFVSANKIVIKTKTNQKFTYNIQKYLRSNQQTCIHQRPIVWKGETVSPGQILTDGPAISNTELSLGQNVLIAYMPWQGYNFEDAILISEKLLYEDIFTSIHIERYKIDIDQTVETSEQITKNIPNLNQADLNYLNEDGIVKVGTFVKSGDILVGKVISNTNSEQFPESKLLRAIFGSKAKGVKDNSYRISKGNYGRVIETVNFYGKTKLTYKFKKIYIFIAQIRKIQVGDKIAGRHGNKGIISRILPLQDMPFLPDGTPVDILLNPLGVPSRMNVGQLYECLLGFAGDKLNVRFKILPFDEMYGLEISRILINKKLRQASKVKNESWIFNPYCPGKIILIDGRTGVPFENPITVGNAYMLKLIHLVDDKMHARSTGPYSLITQQPLKGKAQRGGQRFGEMEVWALEGFGAAFTLKELLTVKSDDMEGRNEVLNAIVRGQKIPKFGIPESFKVLIHELRSIGLDISTYKLENFNSLRNYQSEVNLIEKYNSLTKTFSPNFNINFNFNDISF